jgi:hypothetical protein
MDMSGMSSAAPSSEPATMTASMMEMVFFSSTGTALYSSMWVPKNIGQYAGTCIFLILLATIFRALLALKAWKEAAWLDSEFQRRYVTVAGKLPKAERMSSDSKRMILTENGVEEDVMVVKKVGMEVIPWRLSIDPVRALLDTVIAGVGYLLYASLPSLLGDILLT